ncbi:MAG: ABC transporter permease, partial [Eubacteriales bacterium]|nr:ABC transporter permease [Eubacteriales bacterium]
MNFLNNLMKPGMLYRKKTYRLLISVIIMTIILEFSIIIFSSSMEKTKEEQRKMSYGGWDAAVYEADETILDKLTTHATVDKIGYMTGLGHVLDRDGGIAGIIGFIDNTAANLGNISMLDGNLPMSADEIAVEMSYLSRLGYSYKLGQDIDIDVQRTDKNGSVITENKTYQLCGVVKNYSGLWIGSENGLVSFFINEYNGDYNGEPLFTHAFCGMKDAFKKYTNELSALPAGHGKFIKNTYTYLYLSDKPQKSDYTKEADNPADGRWMIVLLNVLSAFLMMNILNNSLNERKKSLVLMRCIGASKPQIVKIYVGEILLALLIALPAGIIFGLVIPCISYYIIKIMLFGELWIYIPVDSLLICVSFLLMFIVLTVIFGIMQIFMMPLRGNVRQELPVQSKHKNKKPINIKSISDIFSGANRGKAWISFILSLLNVTVLLFTSYDCWIYYEDYLSLKRTYPADYEFGFMMAYFEPLYHMSEDEMIKIKSTYGVETVRGYKISDYLPITWENMHQSDYAEKTAETVFAKYAGKSSVHGTVYGLSADNINDYKYYIDKIDSGAFSYDLFSEGTGVILSLPAFYMTPDGDFTTGDMPSGKMDSDAQLLTESTVLPGSMLDIEGENGTVSVTVMGIIYSFDEFTAQAFLNKPYSIIGSYELSNKIKKAGHQTYEYIQIIGNPSMNYLQ